MISFCKKGILNGELNALIGRLDHGDHIMVSNAEIWDTKWSKKG